MTKHGDFCLSPKVLIPALKALLTLTLVLFAWGWFAAWFAPPMPMTRDFIIAAIFVLVLAYLVKVFLKYGGKEETLWTRVAGCLSSVMIALGSLALAWGVGNGFPRYTSVGIIAPVGFFILALVIGSFLEALDLILKGEKEKNGGRVGR